MGQHSYTVRSNPFFIIHRGKPDLCYLQCVDTMLVRSDSTEGYFILMLGVEKSLIISLMVELFLYNLRWHSLSFAYSMLRVSSIIVHLEDRIYLRSKANKFCDYTVVPLHSSLNRPGVFLFALIFSSPKVWHTEWSTG